MRSSCRGCIPWRPVCIARCNSCRRRARNGMGSLSPQPHSSQGGASAARRDRHRRGRGCTRHPVGAWEQGEKTKKSSQDAPFQTSVHPQQPRVSSTSRQSAHHPSHPRRCSRCATPSHTPVLPPPPYPPTFPHAFLLRLHTAAGRRELPSHDRPVRRPLGARQVRITWPPPPRRAPRPPARARRAPPAGGR